MIIDKEEHREILRAAVKNMPISGPAGDPEMLRHILAVHEILAAINGATVGVSLTDTVYNDVRPG